MGDRREPRSARGGRRQRHWTDRYWTRQGRLRQNINMLGQRLIYMNTPERRPRRAAYALPTLFTAGNVYLGFYALLEAYLGSMQYVQGIAGAASHYQTAAIAIGVAVFLD